MADMHRLKDPGRAYRTVEFDALVLGSDGTQLVRLCFDRALSALDRALGEGIGFQVRSRALSDALLAITALREGVDTNAPLGATLVDFYTTAADAVSGAIMQFDERVLAAVRSDLSEIRDAIVAA